MARQRFDTAPEFNVDQDSVVIRQAVGSAASILEVLDESATPVFTIHNSGEISMPSVLSVGGVSSSEMSHLSGVSSNIQTQLNTKAPSATPTFTGQVTLPSTTSIGSVSSTEISYLDGVTSGIQNQIDAKAPLANPTFTGTVTLPSDTSIGNVSSTEIGYVDGVTSAIQTQLNSKAPIASPTFTGTVNLPSDTTIGSVSSTELGYLDGVTSAIQTQLNAKAPTASPTFTGTLTAANLSVSGNVTSMLNFPTASTTNISAAGTLKGNGSVVQFAYLSHGPYDLSAGSWVASVPITPKYSNSYMYVWINYHAYKYNNNATVNNHYYLRNLSSGSDLRQNPYMVYSSADYMFQGVVSGVESAGSTGARTYAFYVDASAGARIYFYWLTMYVLEIAN